MNKITLVNLLVIIVFEFILPNSLMPTPQSLEVLVTLVISSIITNKISSIPIINNYIFNTTMQEYRVRIILLSILIFSILILTYYYVLLLSSIGVMRQV